MMYIVISPFRVSPRTFLIDRAVQLWLSNKTMKRSLLTAVVFLLGCHAEVLANTTVDIYNTWELYDEESEEVIGVTISDDFRESASLKFQLTDAPEGGGYQVDITTDDASEESPAW